MTRTPCQLGDPEDWFITKWGEYRGEIPELTEEQEQQVRAEADAGLGTQILGEERERLIQEAVDAANEELVAAMLVRRRRAAEACSSCPVRLECLDLALNNAERHGTWGGVFEEEIQKFHRLRARYVRPGN